MNWQYDVHKTWQITMMYVSLASKCTKCTVKTDAPEYKLTKVHYAIIKHNIQHCPSMVYIKTNYGLSK